MLLQNMWRGLVEPDRGIRNFGMLKNNRARRKLLLLLCVIGPSTFLTGIHAFLVNGGVADIDLDGGRTKPLGILSYSRFFQCR